MTFQIPTASTFTNFKLPYLTPQILVDISLHDVIRSSIAPAGQVTINKYDRIASIDVQLLYVKETALTSALDKVLDNIQDSIRNDLNPENPAGISPLPLGEIETGNPKMQHAVQVDNTQEIKTVCVWIQVKNLRVTFVEQAFTRLKQYVASAVLDA